ncbi:hypothetical protein MASR2M47_15730 [Draconibacterium sp.]
MGGSVLNDNDLDIIPAPTNNSYNGLNPTWEYSVTPDGPWSPAPGSWSPQGNYQWTVASSLMSQIGDYYFRFTLTNSYGCTSVSDIAEVHIISTLTVEAGPPDFICSSTNQTAYSLAGAYVGGYSATTKTGTWSASPNVGTIVQNTSNPAAATYRPPNNFTGDITLTLTTNDPDGNGPCTPLTDTRLVHVLPPANFNGCLAPATWPVTLTNSDGSVNLDCAIRLVGGDNGSGTPGNTDVTHCVGAGNVTFDWSFTSPENVPVMHTEDLQVNYLSGSTGSIPVSKPTNLSVGDLILVTLHFNTNPGNITAPTGFNLINRTPDSNGTATVASYYKIATGSEPANYTFTTSNNTQYTRIESVRVSGQNATNPIGAVSADATNAGNVITAGYRTNTINSVNIAAANSILVAALSVANSIQYPEAPTGMETFYFNDSRTAARVAWQMYTATGATGNKIFKWPTYGSVNQNAYATAAHMFVINPASNGGDAAYYTINGTPTLLGNTNGASGTKTVAVASGDVFGFRAGTTTNTGGEGVLTIFNVTIPNDKPVLTGIDTVKAVGCQDISFAPTFVAPTVTDDCGTPVIKAGYPVTDDVIINDCNRIQKRTWIYVDECGEESLPFVQTATWSILSPLTVSCPIDPKLPACTDPAMISAAYDIWKAGFTANGGCNVATNIIAVPPLILTNIACGDTLSFTFTATDFCGQTASCSATFTVQPVDPLTVNKPDDPMLPGCSDDATITAAYNTWKAGFSYNGGCSTVSDNIADIPALTDISCGGQLTFIYTASNTCGQSQSEISTFTVEPLTELSINIPPGVTLPLCSETTDIQAAYDAWKAGFTTTGGCAVVTNMNTFPALGDIACGGTLTFTFTAENGLALCENPVQGTSDFTVTEAPELTLACPADPNIDGCLGIQEITDAYDTWVDGFKVYGGCNVTTNIASIPPLGDMVCNGQITFTFIAENGTGVCANRKECTSTFTIGAAPAITVIVPDHEIVTGCSTNQEIIDAFNLWKSKFKYVGGCQVTTSDLSVYTVPNSCGGTTTVEYTVTDNCGQSVTRSANFTINPEPLVATCPDDEVQDACQTQAEVDAAFAIWKAKFGFTGGCGTVPTDLSTIEAPDACGGTIIVNYSVADVCGQVSNCSAIFTIDSPSDVLKEPSFIVPADLTINRDATCNYDADSAITGVPTDLADNCTDAGNLTMNHTDSIAAGTCASDIIIYRKWTVLDNCLNETSKIQIITVADNTPPVVVCAPDVNGIADNSECEATGVNLGTTTATDNCQVASLVGVRSDGFAITDPFPVGVTTITWTATDACGNGSSCTQTVTMVDGITQPPVITCPADVVQNAGPNNCYLENVVIPDPTATDNCEVATISWIMTGATTGASRLDSINYVGGETFNVGVTTITYTATDSAGNFATCKFTVTIKDVTPPVIEINTCKDVTDVAAPNNCSKIPGTLFDPNYTDTCWPKDSLKLSWVLTGATTGSGAGTLTNQSFNVGVTFVEYTVTDPDGNHAECDFKVTIKDVTAPEINLTTCKDVTESADADNCAKTPAAIMDPTYSDNCWHVDSLDLTYIIRGATTGTGSGSVTGLTFNVGVSRVTYIVTDPDGNLDSCFFNVTIIDVTPPVINMTNCVDVADIADFNNCSKVSAKLIDPVYADSCWPKDSLKLSWKMTGATTGSGFGTVTDSAFNVGVTIVEYIVSDPDGNKDTCSFTVTIKDVTPPSVGITGCEDVTDVTDGVNCTHVPGEIKDPAYSDACWDVADLTIIWTMTGATIRNGSGSVKGEAFNAGVTTVKYYVSDPDNNIDSCDFTVTIIPFNPPAFTTGCPPDIIAAPNDPGVCEADLTIPDPTVNDPCKIGYTIVNDFNNTANASGKYPVGTTIVRWIITPSVGMPDTCYQTVTVADTQAPEIAPCAAPRDLLGCDTLALTGPVFSSIGAASTYAEFSNTINLGAATDNCGIDSVTYIDVISAGICPIVITRTWTVFDAAGNSATCDQIININDITPPVIDCPANDTIPSDFNFPYSDYKLPTFRISDNCTDSVNIAINWVISGVTNDSGAGLIPSPYRFNRGLNTISYTFKDACGNITPCTFTLFVLFPPDIDCLPPLTYNTDADACTHRLPTGPTDPGVPANIKGDVLTWEYTIFNPDGSIGGTGSSTGVTASPIDPYDFMLGASTIRWVGINASGTDTCSQLITVVDSIPPTFEANDFEDCVERLSSAVYTGNADNIQYNPDYPNGDYKIMKPPGDTFLDIDLNTYIDNCCVLADGYSLFWKIEFDGNDPLEPDISGTGQPSTYKDIITGDPMDILLWGDGVHFQQRIHTITYTMTDCHGNVSAPVVKTITINPRPQLIKMP